MNFDPEANHQLGNHALIRCSCGDSACQGSETALLVQHLTVDEQTLIDESINDSVLTEKGQDCSFTSRDSVDLFQEWLCGILCQVEFTTK